MATQIGLISPGTLFEDFENLSDWVVGSEGTATADTTHVKTGTQSLKLQTDGAGVSSSFQVTKTINANLSRAGAMGVWFFVENDPDTSSFKIRFSSNSGFTSYFEYSSTSDIREGWNFVVIGQSQWANTGGESWANLMIRMRLIVGGASIAQVGTVYIDSFYIQRYNRPKCVIFFDDFPSTTYDVAYPVMQKYGFKGTHAGVSSYAGLTGKLTLAQIKEMHDVGGWDVINHTVNHYGLATDLDGSYAAQYPEISGCKDWLIANGFTRNNEHLFFAYPKSSWNANSLQVLSDLGYLNARSNFTRPQPPFSDNVYLMCGQSNDSGTTAAQIKAKIDQAIAAGSTCVLYFHILRTPEDIPTTLDPAIFTAVIDYIATKREQMDVITYTEWYRFITENRKLA